MDERLLEYIRKRIELGHNPEKIKQVLLNSGWNAEVVEAHLKQVLIFKPKRSFIDGVKHELASNSEKYFVIGLIAVFIIVVSFIGLNYLFDSNKEKIESSGGSKDLSPLSEAENLNLLNTVLIKNDATICDETGDYSLKEKCKNLFFRNETACDEKCKDSKIFNSAIIGNNGSLCGGINDEKIRQDCLGIINKEPIIKNSESSCDQACKDKGLLNSALISQNSSICLGITDSSIKDQCKQIFSRRGDKI